MKIKYRVNHYYADENRYDHIDFQDKEVAIMHYSKSRSAKEIWKMAGRNLLGQINPRTGQFI